MLHISLSLREFHILVTILYINVFSGNRSPVMIPTCLFCSICFINISFMVRSSFGFELVPVTTPVVLDMVKISSLPLIQSTSKLAFK